METQSRPILVRIFAASAACVTHLADDWQVLRGVGVVAEVRLVQHSRVDPGCIVPASHPLERVVAQLGDAHVAVAVDLTAKKTRSKQQQGPITSSEGFGRSHWDGLGWHAAKLSAECRFCTCHPETECTCVCRCPRHKAQHGGCMTHQLQTRCRRAAKVPYCLACIMLGVTRKLNQIQMQLTANSLGCCTSRPSRCPQTAWLHL